MKQYERAYDVYMPSRLPVIVRLDGKGFSKFTKKIYAEKPFDEFFCKAMTHTMQHVAGKVEGCVFAYTQSDEITFVIRNDQSLESTPWFGNRVQKITSIMASMASAAFNFYMLSKNRDDGTNPLAYFDARAFIVPDWQEAINCLIWRQNDATKNSISAACYYESAKKIGKKTARKEMHGLNQKQQQEMLFQHTSLNWNNYPIRFKRGVGCYKVAKEMTHEGKTFMRNSWQVDLELPVFTQDPSFLRGIFGLVGEDIEQKPMEGISQS
ncbi:MAG: tRNA(His) guanylyltransferase Thg1 family protein [Promethearchaeota archaeon]